MNLTCLIYYNVFINKIISYIKKNISIIELVPVVLVIVLFPWISRVNFMQNDDWNRTSTVIRFISGDTSLLQVTATTFYVQGILGFLFSLVFGWEKLPFLTLFISVFNFYIFAKILNDHFKLNRFRSILIGLIFFFTPIHFYSSIGFMTENYTVFFLLLAIYFLLRHEKDRKPLSFLTFNLFGVFSFFTKQNGIILSFAYVPYLLIKKRYREALLQTTIVGGLLLYYFKLFPRTEEMYSKGFTYENFAIPGYAYSLVYGIIITVVSFLLPFVFNFVINTIFENRKKTWKIIFILVSAGVLYFRLNKYFVPDQLAWQEYPYFENTFERTGFFPRSIHGTKYYFKWNYDIFRYWDLGSRILLSLFIPCLVLLGKKVINIYSISIVGYFILMILTKRFYDRYILPLIPLGILFLVVYKKKESNLRYLYLGVNLIFAAFISVLSLQMGADFIVTNNYVWGRSETLVDEDVLPKDISATMAWRRVYGRKEMPQFLFSFDNPDKNPELLGQYDLFEEKDTSFRGSIFVDPKLYLYIRKESEN